MSFCPFRSTADKEVECKEDCMLYIKEEIENTDQKTYKKYKKTKSYCTLTYNAVKDVNYENVSLITNDTNIKKSLT